MSGDLLHNILALFFAIALIYIFWSIVMYYVEQGSEWGKKEYKHFVLNGITALFLLMCLYGVIEWGLSFIGF